MTTHPVRISLHDITVIQFATFPEVPFTGKVDHLRLKVDFETVPSRHCITVIMRFQYEVTAGALVVLEFAVEYKIHEDDWKGFFQEDGALVIPLSLARHLSVIATGTGRGILHEKLQSADRFRSLTWPIVDLTKIVVEDVRFDPVHQ